MRKQDRVAADQQQSRQEQSDKKPQPKEREAIKGSSSADHPTRPQRQGNKLPLPD